MKKEAYSGFDLVRVHVMESEQPLHPQSIVLPAERRPMDYGLSIRVVQHRRYQRLSTLSSRAPRQLSGVR